MKTKVNDFVDLFPDFHDLEPTDQITRLIYFHTIEEQRETVSIDELTQHFHFADLPVPKNLPQKLGNMCSRANLLICREGQYSLQRSERLKILAQVLALRGQIAAPAVAVAAAFEFPDKQFQDAKIRKLLEEAGKCHSMGCWNACGILVRIIIERALDAIDPSVKAKQGLKAKINFASAASGLPLSASVQDGLKQLHNAKLVGDIVAHHTSTLLDEGDISTVLTNFRVLLKEVKNI